MTEIGLFKHAKDTVALEPGEVLFREGDPGEVMFAVVEGRIELSRHGHGVEEVGPGGILGELALIDASPRSATATAGTAARVAGWTRSSSRSWCRSTRPSPFRS